MFFLKLEDVSQSSPFDEMTEKRPFVLKNIVNHLLYPHHERESTLQQKQWKILV